jgi:hypothetical protein
MLYVTYRVVVKLSLERGFRYFKVSPIKAFRDICHVSVDDSICNLVDEESMSIQK